MPGHVLIAVHGYEPPRWANEVTRRVTRSAESRIRLLAVVDAPQPPAAALLPAARRRYGAAVLEWRRLAEERTRATLDELLAAFDDADVIWRSARRVDPARTIALCGAAWQADVIVVGRDTRPWQYRWLLGSVHERLLRFAPCTVLVTPPATQDRAHSEVPRLSTDARAHG